MEDWEKGYSLKTAVIKRVSDYTRFDFQKVLDLPYSYFLLLNRESWIYSFQKTKDGMEILKNLWRLQQKNCDEKAVF